MFLRNKKGQAAVTDPLYFLVIVTGLCVFLIGFANQYGITIAERTARQYTTDYCSSALKTVLYSSINRAEGGLTADDEVDYLLVYLKEQHAKDPSADLPPAVQKKIADNIKQAMGPFGGAYDYLFYLRKGSTAAGSDDYIYTFIHVTTSRGDGGTADLVCNDSTGGQGVSDDRVDALIASVGTVSRATTNVIVLEAVPTLMHKEGEAVLVMWPAVVTQPPFSASEWGCSPLSTS